MASRKKHKKNAKFPQPSSQPNPKLREVDVPDDPVLRFTPTAWAKLQYFCHRGDTEIGGFGLTSFGNSGGDRDLLLIEDFMTVKQEVSAVTVSFDDEAVADLFVDQVEAGRKPEQFARIWLHTHPGRSAEPSGVDEETFARVFGASDWAVMFILAKGGATYARLRFNIGPGGEVRIPVEVEYGEAFGPSDHAAWEAEYQTNIHPEPAAVMMSGAWGDDDVIGADNMGLFDADDEWAELELLARVRDADPDELEELFGYDNEVIL